MAYGLYQLEALLSVSIWCLDIRCCYFSFFNNQTVLHNQNSWFTLKQIFWKPHSDLLAVHHQTFFFHYYISSNFFFILKSFTSNFIIFCFNGFLHLPWFIYKLAKASIVLKIYAKVKVFLVSSKHIHIFNFHTFLIAKKNFVLSIKQSSQQIIQSLW